MQCPKGGNVCAFLSSLSLQRNELLAAGITISNEDFEQTVLDGIPEALATYVSLMLSQSQLDGKQREMKDIMHILLEEADCMKNRCMPKDHSQGKGKNQSQLDEALAVTNSSDSGKKRRKGKCHYCKKDGHWARDCFTKKQEEAAQAQSGQAAQASSNTSSGTSKPENKPVGSANIATIDDNSDGDGFWVVKEEETHTLIYEPDPKPSDMESDDNDDEASHAKLAGVEDEQAFDWFGFDDQLAKEGEESHAKEEANAATLEEEDAPCSKAQPIPHHVQHAHIIMDTPAAPGAPDEEEDCLPTVSPCGEHHTPKLGQTLLERVQAMGCIWLPRQQQHATRLEDRTATWMQDDKMPSEVLSWPVANSQDKSTRGCNFCAHHPGGSEPANTRMQEDSEQFHGFHADMQAHRASWPRPGTATAKQDTHLGTAALLEGEESRRVTRSSEQAAAPTTPSTFNTHKSPPLHAPHIPSVQPHRGSRIHTPLCIKRNLNPQPGGRVAHVGTHVPCLASSLQCPGAFVEDPGKSGGVHTVEDGVPAPLKVLEAMKLASVAENTDPGGFEPPLIAAARCSLDWPPCKEAIKEPLPPALLDK